MPEWRARTALLAIALVVSGLVWTAAPAGAWSQPPRRIAGTERFQTSVDLSVAAFPDGAPAAVLVSGGSFPDGLSAGPLAALVEGPVLLTPPDALPANVEGELRRLDVDRVYIVGGTAVVGDAVAAKAQEITGEPARRISGADRYATSAEVASRFASEGEGEVFLAGGEDFADALTGGAAAADVVRPLLLTRRDELPEATESILRDLDPTDIVVLGGKAAVSDEAVQKAGAIAPVERLAGSDRFATAAAIAMARFGEAEEVLLAQGFSFPDALAAAPLAALRDAPIVLGSGDCTPDPTNSLLRGWDWPAIIGVGGPAVLAPFSLSLKPCTGVPDGQLAPGVTLETRVVGGPNVVKIVTLDRRRGPQLRLTTATGKVFGRMGVSDIARRDEAIAAVNGDFFYGPTGLPSHPMAIDGRILHAPGLNNTIVGWDPQRPTWTYFGKPQVMIELDTDTSETPLVIGRVNDGVATHSNELVLHTKEAPATYDPPNPSCRASMRPLGEPARNSDGEMTQRYDVRDVTCDDANLTITNTATDDVLVGLQNTVPGDQVRDMEEGEEVVLRWSLHPDAPMTDAVGSNSMLVFNHEVSTDVTNNSGPFYEERAPRTALCVMDDGQLRLVTVDGRQSGWSVGMTPRQLADYLVSLDVLHCANLDGGGSTTVVVNGLIANRPSDGAERRVGNALLITAD